MKVYQIDIGDSTDQTQQIVGLRRKFVCILQYCPYTPDKEFEKNIRN